MGLLDDRIAIVTGAGAGLGRGIARRFAREGASVLIAEINQANGKRTADEINAAGFPGRAVFLHTDVSDKAHIERAVKAAIAELGGLHILVNNASALSPNLLLEQKTEEMLMNTLTTGLLGTWRFMQAVLPHFKAHGGGRIINFHSVDADAGAWLHADYNANKAAIQALTRSAAVEWGRFNVLVNAIAPAGAGTVYEQLVKDIPGFAEMAAAGNPLGRVGDAEEDIAPAVVFLASELSRYVTGQTLNVDGGVHIVRYDSKPHNLAELDAKTK